MPAKEFRIAVSDEALDNLRQKLRHTTWFENRHEAHWELGTDRAFMELLVDYWQHRYDWRERETLLNRYPQFRCKVDDVEIHFYHIQGKGNRSLPLILTHGWPDSFIRYQKVIPLLTQPVSSGRYADLSFDLVIPSLPGFGFSTQPHFKGQNNAEVAQLWKKLMVDKLGYDKFGAVGGDIGSGVTRYLAFNYPEHLTGIHISDIGLIWDITFSGNPEALSDEYAQYRQAAQQWLKQEGAYISIQSTKPQTLAYALSDSPAGLAAWILEKFHAWSDCAGDLLSRFTCDELLDNIMTYWVANAIGTSMRMYHANIHSLPPIGRIEVPTGMAIFPKDVLLPPKSWAEQKLNLVRWSEMPRGGHFAAMEEPELFADDVLQFFGNLLSKLP